MMIEINETSQLFAQAAMLMVTGMGFVFAFLSLLIVFIKYAITPLASRFPDEETTLPSSNNEQSTHVIAAITAAISKYRQQHPHK